MIYLAAVKATNPISLHGKSDVIEQKNIRKTIIWQHFLPVIYKYIGAFMVTFYSFYFIRFMQTYVIQEGNSLKEKQDCNKSLRF